MNKRKTRGRNRHLGGHLNDAESGVVFEVGSGCYRLSDALDHERADVGIKVAGLRAHTIDYRLLVGRGERATHSYDYQGVNCVRSIVAIGGTPLGQQHPRTASASISRGTKQVGRDGFHRLAWK